MTRESTLILRCDASVPNGTGHVMRCLALAQAWQDAGGSACFAMAQHTPAIEERLRTAAIGIAPIRQMPGSLEDASESIELARIRGSQWVVVDGYHFGAQYQQKLQDAGLKVLFVDDNGHAAGYPADLVLNQNVHADREMYRSLGANTRLLLGTRYALLRREFSLPSGFRRETPEIGRKVLVTFGGSDPENVTLNVVEALERLEIPELEAVVIVGGSNTNLESLRAAAARSGAKIRLLDDVANMAEWMKWADLAVSAAGTTCWEMCLLGLPSLLIDIAPNQTPVARELHRIGAAIHFGQGRDAVPEKLAASLQNVAFSKENRAALSRNASALVDGRGASRVMAAIRRCGLRLRSPEPSDSRILWEWANDPVARAVSFHSAPISWDEHQQWFAAKLKDPQSVIYVGEDRAGAPVGQVRFHLATNHALLSIVVAPECRGMGWGKDLIRSATQALYRTGFTGRVEALVKPDNQASIRLFESTGFEKAGSDIVAGQPALRFTRDSESGVHVG